MRKWSWLLVATAALSCSPTKREFAAAEGGAPGNETEGGAGATAGGTTGAGGAVSGLGGRAGFPAGQGGDAGDPPLDSGDAGAGGACCESSCDGCWVGHTCVADGAVDPENPCRTCQPEVATDAYSVNEGAECGSGPSACSGQDLCSAAGVCEANHVDDGVPCSGGACDDGTCRAGTNPFDCIAPTPPTVEFTASVYSLISEPPTPTGGTIPDGRYVPVRFDLYVESSPAGIDIRTFEFSKGYVQAASRYFSLATMGAYIPEVRFAGSYSIDGTTLSFDLTRCDPQYDIDIPTLSYSVTSNGLITSIPLKDGGTLVTSYARQ